MHKFNIICVLCQIQTVFFQFIFMLYWQSKPVKWCYINIYIYIYCKIVRLNLSWYPRLSITPSFLTHLSYMPYKSHIMCIHIFTYRVFIGFFFLISYYIVSISIPSTAFRIICLGAATKAVWNPCTLTFRLFVLARCEYVLCLTTFISKIYCYRLKSVGFIELTIDQGIKLCAVR